MLNLRQFVYWLLLSICLANGALAKPNTTPTHKLRVGVIQEMPFSQIIDGHYSGIAIDIWENIASTNKWDYTYVSLSPNIYNELNRLSESGDLDIIIGLVSVNSYGMKVADFSRPFFLSSIGVITQKHELNIFEVLSSFLSKTLFFSVIILIASFVIFIHLLWFIERNHLVGVSSNYYPALSKDMWQHLFKNGLSMPTTLAGRLVTLVWIVFAAALITSINANYTAAMTVNLSQSTSKITTLDDLRAVKVAGTKGKASVEAAEDNGIVVEKVNSFKEATDLLVNSEVDAVVCEAPVGIEYLRLHGTKKYVMSPLIIRNDELAFALRLNSPLRHKVDLGITKLQDNGTAIAICRRYIGDEATRCDM